MCENNLNILIVDINLTYAKNLERYLNTIGFNVLGITNNHLDTITIIKNNNIDLILTDIDINGKIDGIESCNTIYRLFKIPSILVTSFSDEETLRSIQNSSAFAYIRKPYRNEILKVNILLVINKLKNKKTTKNHKVELKKGLKFCMKNYILYRNNYEINITKNEKALIYALIKHKNNNISHEQLFNYIWENTEFSLNKLRGAIFRLKKKVPEIQISNNYEIGYKIE